MIETGIIETELDGRWFKILEDRSRFCGLLPLQEHHLSRVFLSGAAHIDSFRADGGRYLDLVEPEGGVEVRLNALVVTRAERDRFERAHGLSERVDSNGSPATPIATAVNCSDDGSWIKIRGREYLFSGLLQKTAIRRLYEALRDGSPRLPMQTLLEEIESRSRHISQVFSGADPRWRDIIGYGKGQVWLKINA